MEFSRFLCDDGHSASRRNSTGSTQDSRRVDVWNATGLDAALRMWQESRGAFQSGAFWRRWIAFRPLGRLRGGVSVRMPIGSILRDNRAVKPEEGYLRVLKGVFTLPDTGGTCGQLELMCLPNGLSVGHDKRICGSNDRSPRRSARMCLVRLSA